MNRILEIIEGIECECHHAMLRVCLWMMRAEYDIGFATGMNPQYLHCLRRDITRMEGDLNRMEINHG